MFCVPDSRCPPPWPAGTVPHGPAPTPARPQCQCADTPSDIRPARSLPAQGESYTGAGEREREVYTVSWYSQAYSKESGDRICTFRHIVARDSTLYPPLRVRSLSDPGSREVHTIYIPNVQGQEMPTQNSLKLNTFLSRAMVTKHQNTNRICLSICLSGLKPNMF